MFPWLVEGLNWSPSAAETHQLHIMVLDSTKKKAFVELNPPSLRMDLSHLEEAAGFVLCVSDCVQSHFDSVFYRRKKKTLKLTAEIILQLLLIGFSLN